MLVATGDVSGQVLVFDMSAPASPKLIKTIDVGKMAFDPVFTPGRAVRLGAGEEHERDRHHRCGQMATRVARIKDANFKQPQQIVFSPDGATAFVTNNNKMDHMADPGDGGPRHAGMDAHRRRSSSSTSKTRKVEKAIPLGKNLTGMGTRARR